MTQHLTFGRLMKVFSHGQCVHNSHQFHQLFKCNLQLVSFKSTLEETQKRLALVLIKSMDQHTQILTTMFLCCPEQQDTTSDCVQSAHRMEFTWHCIASCVFQNGLPLCQLCGPWLKWRYEQSAAMTGKQCCWDKLNLIGWQWWWWCHCSCHCWK